MTAARLADADSLLADLNDEQRAAVTCVRGPVVITAGAGSGKTRVISRRAAYAAATGAVDANQMLLITFTEKAGLEMSKRIGDLGLTGAIANNVHSVALRQLNWLWPRVHSSPAPALLPSPYRIVNGFLRRAAPTVNARDVVTEIGWAKCRALAPDGYLEALGGRQPGVDPDLVARAFADYERRKRAAHQVDFDDLLIELARLINKHNEVARLVRSRRSWICVDEYQDTNHIQDTLFSAWLGDSTDFCVVGDPDQAIFGFTGATSDYLNHFPRRWPAARSFDLAANYRSTPQVLELANRLLAADGRSKRLRAVEPAGPEPLVAAYADDAAEVQAVVGQIKALHRGGLAYPDMTILFRQHAHKLPFEAALSAAKIPYVSADPFFARREVVLAVEALAAPATGNGLAEVASRTWAALFGFDPSDADNAGDARYDAVSALLNIAAVHAKHHPAATPADLAAEFRRRAADEEDNAGAGVELTTYHQAKGREWPAVFLPMLEEGTLPDFRASSNAERAEEWRLLYVGITRAEKHLWITRASRRTRGDKTFTARPSSFLRGLEPPTPPAPLWKAAKPPSGGWRTSTPQSDRGSASGERWPPPKTMPIAANTVLPRGTKVIHRDLGRGTVWGMRGNEEISVRFGGTTRNLRWPQVATSGKLRRSAPG